MSLDAFIGGIVLLCVVLFAVVCVCEMVTTCQRPYARRQQARALTEEEREMKVLANRISQLVGMNF